MQSQILFFAITLSFILLIFLITQDVYKATLALSIVTSTLIIYAYLHKEFNTLKYVNGKNTPMTAHIAKSEFGDEMLNERIQKRLKKVNNFQLF